MERAYLFCFLIIVSISGSLCRPKFYQYVGGKVVETDSADFVEGSIALAGYEEGVHVTGWDYLEIIAQDSATNEEIAHAAGVLEGYVTANIFEMHVENVLGTLVKSCLPDHPNCDKVTEFLKKNYKWLNDQIKENPDSEYWRQVDLIKRQVDGLAKGFSIARPKMQVLDTWDSFWLMNMLGDLDDIREAIKAEAEDFYVHKEYVPLSVKGYGHCSALIKLVPGSNLFVAQDTWNTYQSMLRIQKRYSLPFLRNNETARVPGSTMSMSSYPGSLSSGDDFYLISSGLATLETTIGNGNASLWQFVQPEQVPEWIRSLVANRLAKDGKSWSEIFKRYNSGTYNNQWMVVDYNKYNPDLAPSNLPDGLLWVIEQIPSYIQAEDRTENLRKDTYWASYNVAAFPEVFNMSGNQEMVKKFGDWFTYDKNPRALIFKRDQGKVKDLKSMFNLMRYNDYKNDPLSKCDCEPPYSAENAIAARCDLNPENGKYPFAALGHRQHGATDAKVTSYDLFQNYLAFMAVSGPPYNETRGIPPFQWSTSGFSNVGHKGHPDIWKFPPVIYQW